MTSPSFNYFYRVELQVAQYTLGGIKNDRLSVRELITSTYNFVNKPLRDASTASDRETYIPILQSVGEMTLSAGDILPSTSVSSIQLDDSRGSFGPDRRFSDLLERFTIIDQPINVYIGESNTETDAPSSWTKIGGGKVTSWSKALSGDSPTMTIQVEPFKISDRIMNLEISRDISGMENTPQSSLGKSLPIIFNKVNSGLSTPIDRYPQIIPTRVSADGAETAKYALATQIYQVTKARVQTNYYAKKTWADGADIWASISFTRTAPDYTTPTVGTYYSLNTYAGRAYKIPQMTATDNETGFVVTGVELKAKGQGTSGRVSTASLDVFILLVDKVTYNVVQELTRGRVPLTNYDALNNAGGTFSVNISFDAPIVVELTSDREYDFYVGWSATGVAANELELHKYNTTTPILVKSNTVSSTDSYDQWKIGTAEQIVSHKLRIVTAAATAHENTYTKDGYTYSSLTLSQPSPDSGQANCDLDSLSIVALVEGFCKYSDNSRIYDPPTILKLLSYSWDGEQWSDASAVDTTTLATSHYTPLFTASSGNHRARYLSGVIENKSTYSQAISEIARGSASKVGILSDGKLFIHPWGVVTPLTYVIPQADIIPLSWETRDETSIVNRTQITFEKSYVNNISQEESNSGYKYSIDYSNSAYLPVQQITEQSRSLFGAKNIVENVFPVFGFSDTNPVVGLPGYLTGSATASQPSSGGVVIYSVDFLADYYISRFALPFVYCSFVVPYQRYKDIQMFDVISFQHSEFPAFYGTDPAARAAAVNDGTNVTAVQNANFGEELVRAQSYRGLVEAVSYVMAMEHAPAIRLTVQVLLNTEYDPT
jgi:hypothetical protein